MYVHVYILYKIKTLFFFDEKWSRRFRVTTGRRGEEGCWDSGAQRRLKIAQSVSLFPARSASLYPACLSSSVTPFRFSHLMFTTSSVSVTFGAAICALAISGGIL